MVDDRDMMTRAVRGLVVWTHRLLLDARGNMMLIFAAALVPTLMIVGSAIDIGRGYAVKSRLQQACDAGVLAGRRFLDPNSNALNATASTQAQAFFGNNFTTGWINTAKPNFAVARNGADEVTGVANIQVPMEIMGAFGMTPINIQVNCASRFQVPDADIMFVLDNTGSMANQPDDTGGSCCVAYTAPDGTTRYKYTEASGSKISGLRDAVLLFYDTVTQAADASTQIRYGFVPYSSAANVGRLLPTSAFASQWTFQSRKPQGTSWVYQQMKQDVSKFVGNGYAIDPTQANNQTDRWTGCIEESGDTAPISTTMDPDLVPSQSNPSSLFGPLWPEVEWSNTQDYPASIATPLSFADSNMQRSGRFVCPKAASRLAVMTRNDVSGYVNAVDFVADGSTYHDTGMLWGLRLISPTGMFAADTAARAGHDAPNRYIIFMTDGMMNTSTSVYSQFGWEAKDGRTGSGDANHITRFLALCDAAKSRNISVWTIAFGTTAVSNPAVKSLMTQCASSPSRALLASDNAGLKSAFQTIAVSIARLRLVQ